MTGQLPLLRFYSYPVFRQKQNHTYHSKQMKALPILLATSMLVVAPLVSRSQTVVFNDSFVVGGSTLNGTSTPGGTASASTTSYDIASTKTATTAPAISAGRLKLSLNGGTTAGYLEFQALFASTPVQLVNVGDCINLTFSFTNTSGTLLAGGSGSLIDVGLFNSGGVKPLAGTLNNSGLSSATTYATGGCAGWQGYVASVAYAGIASRVYTRPMQSGTTSANQDLLYSGAGTGLFTAPAGTQIGSTLTSAVTLTTGAKYTMSFTILLSAAGAVTITNNLYSGGDTSGTLLSSQVNTTTGGTTYTNFANSYDGFSIGIANKGTSMNPVMDISRITITTNGYSAPVIAGLSNQTAVAGASLVLNPVVTGNPAPACQWQTNGINLDGATNASLSLTGIQASQNGLVYSLIASNLMGVVTNSMTLSVLVTPSITGLANQAVYVGTSPVLNASVSGMPTPTLRWQLNGLDLADGLNGNGATISGSTSSALSIVNAQAADTGTYSLIASNSAGIVTNSLYLLVSASDVQPTLVGPTNITVIQGNGGTFSAAAYYGLPQPTLQWLDPAGVPIVDATNTSLAVPNVQFSQNGAVYFLVASNAVGSVTNSATLSVIVPPGIASQPSNLTVTNTQAAAFVVGVTGVPAPTFQWYRNGVAISSAANNSATNDTLVIAATTAADAGSSYYVKVTNAAGSTNSQTAILTVNSTMAATAFAPANGAAGLCYDTPLTITFSSVPQLGAAGLIKIFNVTNSTTPVDTINAANGLVQQRVFPGDNQSFSYATIVTNGQVVTIYPHFSVLASNQTYYVTIDYGAFMDAAGASFVGIAATNTWQFTTKAGGPVDSNNPVVNLNGSADYLTVQGAVNDIPSGSTTPRVINIKNGTYTGIVDISGRNNVTFRGQSRLGTLVGFANNANFQVANSGSSHARMAFKVNANDITLENLTITNMTVQGGSQAEALMIESAAKRCIVNNCDIVSRQDTILANVNSSQGYFYNTTVKGNFDYIWGGGNLYFNKCTMLTIAGTGSGQLTAARTDTSASTSTNFPWLNPAGTYSANGMSFVGCSFQSDAGLGNITLAGSNGTSNNVVSWSGCQFATNYVTPSASLFNGNYIFWQNQNTDLSLNPVTFSSLTTIGVTNNDPRLLAATNPVTWLYGWQPQLLPNITGQPTGQAASQGQAVSFTVSATGIPDPTYQWLKNGSPVSGATNATYAIASAVRANAGNYAVVASNSSGSVTSVVATLTYTGNAAPVVANFNWGTVLGQPATLAVIGGKYAPTDADGDSLTIAAVSGATNGTVTTDGANLAYTPTNGAADSFTYTVVDGLGGITVGTVSVTITPATASFNQIGIQPTGGGGVVLTYYGIPGFAYALEWTPSLTAPITWTPLTTNAAALNGLLLFTNTPADGSGFYRTRAAQ